MFQRLLALFLLTLLLSAPLSTPAQAGFDEGKTAYDKGNWIQAILNLRPMVEAGDTRAMILLGNMYMDGHGVGQDSKEAFSLYHQAALLNNTDGMVALGVLYKNGDGVPVNTPLALGWFERAARLGNQLAGFVYAINLYQGSHGPSFDIKPDAEASYRWFRIVATNGPDKKMQKAAEQAAALVVKKLVTDEIARGDREAANWKPEMPDALGPDPEQKLINAAKEKGGGEKDQGDKKDTGDKKTPDQVPPVPEPDKKTEAKQPDAPSSATPAPAAPGSVDGGKSVPEMPANIDKKPEE